MVKPNTEMGKFWMASAILQGDMNLRLASGGIGAMLILKRGVGTLRMDGPLRHVDQVN